MKTWAFGVLIFAGLASLMAASPPAAAQAIRSSEEPARQRTAAVAAETKNAAEALAAKFSGGATQSDAPEQAAQLQPEPPLATTAPEPRPATPPMMAALSESARAAGDHAAANATFAKQAELSDEPPLVKARKKRIAKRNFVVLSGGSNEAAQASKHPPSAPAEKPGDKPEDKPSLLAKIFTPSLWSLPDGDNGEGVAATATRSALQAD